jgi:hypothetical protein
MVVVVPAASGQLKFPTGNTYLGLMYVSGPGPQLINVEFLNGNNAVICTAMLAGQCESGGGVPSGNPCLVQNITVNTGYDPVTGSVITVTANASDPKLDCGFRSTTDHQRATPSKRDK